MDFSFETNNYDQEEDRRKSLMISVFIHLLILLLFLFPFFKELQKNEELNGVLVVFGNPQQNDEEASQVLASSEEESIKPQPEKAIEKSAVKPLEKAQEPVAKVEEQLIQNETVVEQDNMQASIEKNEKAKEELKKQEEQQRAEDARKKELADQKRIEDQKKAEEAKFEKQKSEFGSLFKGDSQKDGSGQRGDEFGEADEGALDALSQGKGAVGEGLGGRSVLFEPEINDSSQKEGRVVVKICVDQSGKVTSAKYTQKGSSTTDLQLIKKAEKAAMEYVFSESTTAKQCGELAVDFKLK